MIAAFSPLADGRGYFKGKSKLQGFVCGQQWHLERNDDDFCSVFLPLCLWSCFSVSGSAHPQPPIRMLLGHEATVRIAGKWTTTPFQVLCCCCDNRRERLCRSWSYSTAVSQIFQPQRLKVQPDLLTTARLNSCSYRCDSSILLDY